MIENWSPYWPSSSPSMNQASFGEHIVRCGYFKELVKEYMRLRSRRYLYSAGRVLNYMWFTALDREDDVRNLLANSERDMRVTLASIMDRQDTLAVFGTHPRDFLVVCPGASDFIYDYRHRSHPNIWWQLSTNMFRFWRKNV